MYGHRFYRLLAEQQAEFLNRELKKGISGASAARKRAEDC